MRVYRYSARKVHSDLELVGKLWLLANPESYGTMRGALRRKAPGVIFIAKDQGQIVGWSFMIRGASSFGVHVFVNPKNRRQGFGGRLLRRVKQESQAQRKMVVGYPDSDQRKLFESVGITRFWHY